MSRGRKRKTDKGSFSEETMRRAVMDVIENKMSLRQAAKEYDLKLTTLHRYITKTKTQGEDIRMAPKYRSRQVFSDAEEISLAQYMIQCSKMCYGKSTKDLRELAYEMAIINKNKMPETWETNKKAGIDWMQGFFKRHPNISVRQPEGCSLSRATAFNQHNVSMFFQNVKSALDRSEKFADGTRIYNLDETGTTTVQKPKRVIAEKGMKQVSQCTSAERGDLVTVCCIISASGNSLPPAMVFPRKNFKEHMINGAPAGTLGLATASGWMNGESFVSVMKHFIKHSGSSIDNPTILIMDNHESHLTIESLNLAKSNGVIIVTLPPHCSNKLQPLDVSCYAPFKAHYNSAVDSWLLHHPGTPMTIYQIAQCVGVAHDRALTPSNIKAGFLATGIFPYDDKIFTNDDFLCSYVTDRTIQTRAPSPITIQRPLSEPTDKDEENRSQTDISILTSPSASSSTSTPLHVGISDTSQSKGNSDNFISPHVFRGFPKAAERKQTNRGRAKSYTCIATDTPEKNKIEDKINKRQANKKPAERRPIRKKLFITKKKQELVDYESSSSNDELQFSSSSDVDMEENGDKEESLKQVNPDRFEKLDRELDLGDFVLVEFKDGLTRKVFYIAQVLKPKDLTEEVEVSFLRKCSKFEGSFTFPAVPDVSLVKLADIKMLLPAPKEIGSTKRLKSFYNFEVNFDLLTIN